MRGERKARAMFRLAAGALLAGELSACAVGLAALNPAQKGKVMAFELKSPAFAASDDIPRKFTCEGPDFSPALQWGEPPAGAASLSLVMDDPDAPAGTWVHWVLYDLPATARELPENVPKGQELANGARQGRNDFGKIGYGGPCPPPGPAHRYFFKLYALDAKTNLKPGSTKAELERAMKGHILAKAELMGRYRR